MLHMYMTARTYRKHIFRPCINFELSNPSPVARAADRFQTSQPCGLYPAPLLAALGRGSWQNKTQTDGIRSLQEGETRRRRYGFNNSCFNSSGSYHSNDIGPPLAVPLRLSA
ncbi:uncharacterized protein YALI1_A00135g [Yarrowia lipolytica]|uniref:Uncharacterized protein n=1 Tax=Yarrowia lipolytica TaxID=4952 RepID=A0A1D8N366_YARLL|nr:hypothetical protein YALI1_A00135g [Yarrowia lipolytica]